MSSEKQTQDWRRDALHGGAIKLLICAGEVTPRSGSGPAHYLALSSWFFLARDRWRNSPRSIRCVVPPDRILDAPPDKALVSCASPRGADRPSQPFRVAPTPRAGGLLLAGRDPALRALALRLRGSRPNEPACLDYPGRSYCASVNPNQAGRRRAGGSTSPAASCGSRRGEGVEKTQRLLDAHWRDRARAQ